MSLTSEIDNENSKIRLFFENNFIFDKFIDSSNQQINNSFTLYPEIKNNYPWSSVGHMTEYLMLLHMGLQIEDLFPMRFAKTDYKKIFNRIKDKYSNVCLFFKEREKFKNLCVDLYRLAIIESVFRTGKKIPLEKIDVLTIDENVFNDMVNIYFKSLVKNEIINNKEHYFCYNPTFNLSSAIGGADADLYLIKNSGNFLLDLKTTIRPKITKEMLFQLLGYVLLDEDNQHNIKEIGVFLTRQNLISNWNINEIIQENSKFATFEQAREGFRSAIYDNLILKYNHKR